MAIRERRLSSDAVELSSDLARLYGDVGLNQVLSLNPTGNMVRLYSDPTPNALLN